MNYDIPETVLDNIIDEINKAIDIPFLNEKQERLLFAFILSVIIGAFLKSQKRTS